MGYLSKMCEIQFIKRYNGNLNNLDYNSFKTMMMLGSINNSDAYGVFNSHFHFKHKGRFTLSGIDKNKIFKDNFIIGHNRLSTGGTKKDNKNNHPFLLNGLILVHNGIISNHIELLDKYKIYHNIQTDSFIILALIDKFFKKNLKKDSERQKSLIKAIKKTCECLEGSYSCFLYDELTKDIYYFKSDATSFYAYINNNVLICSTNTDNINLSYLNEDLLRYKDYCNFKKIKIKEGIIYLINDKNKFSVMDTFDIKKSYSNYPYCDYSSYHGLYGRDLNNNKDNKEDSKEEKIRIIDDILYNYIDSTVNYTFDNKTDEILFSYDAFLWGYLGNIADIVNNKIVVNYYDFCDYLGVKV